MLEIALNFLTEEVKPVAHALDAKPAEMKRIFGRMAELKLLSLRRSVEYGGPNISERDFRFFQEEIARASGALAFLQTQHQSAVNMLGKHASAELRAKYLPLMDSQLCVGVGFSQLRRSGPPICRATKVVGGYQISGQVPWITGFGYFDEYILGASLDDGCAVFGLVPLVDCEGQVLSQPMELTAMQAACTVTAELKNYFLTDEKVAFVKPPDWMRANDAFNVTLQGHFAIGCAKAGVDIVRTNAEKKGSEFLANSAERLWTEIESCRHQLVETQQDFKEETTQKRLELRAWAIELMMRCAHAGVVSSSGAANYAEHPAGRVLREAIVFSVSAQTGAIMECTLNRLVR